MYALFAVLTATAYFPAIVFVYAVMGDAEQLFHKVPGLISHEAPHLARIARPVAALFSNFPLMFLDQLSDFRFARGFAVLSLIAIGCLMLRTLVDRLWISPLVSLTITMGTLCLPGFIFSVMNPTAWPMHILAVLLSVAAYALLARSHLASICFSDAVHALSGKGILEHYFAPDRSRSVAGAFLLFILALYTYPPNALIALVFTVSIVLFSPLPAALRTDLVMRDLVFVGTGMVVYVLLTKLVYLPVGHLMGWLAPPVGGLQSEYRFAFDFGPQGMVGRLVDSLEIAGSLWFAPGSVMATIAVWTLGALAVFISLMRARRREFAYALGGLVLCYVASVAPLAFSDNGFISYRTTIPPTAIAMMVALYLLRTNILILPVVWWATTASIVAIVQLAQNEMAYVERLVRQDSVALIVLDDRPAIEPHQLRKARDVAGRHILPFESGCLSTYCFSELGLYYAAGTRDVAVFRDPALKGTTCTNLRDRLPILPKISANHTKNHSSVEIHSFVKRETACANYDSSWMDLGLHLDSELWRIDRSPWRMFL